jgi:hypothetical protein
MKTHHSYGNEKVHDIGKHAARLTAVSKEKLRGKEKKTEDEDEDEGEIQRESLLKLRCLCG